MALDRINGYLNGYNAYNIPPASDLTVRRPDETVVNPQVPSEPQKEPPKEEPGKLDLTVSEVSSRENASIENVAISFGVYDASSIELFGEKGLASSDMQQAISGMQRDKILHEYQYFVGGKDLTGKDSNIITGTEDGLVIRLK
jgi:hypothetical protein